MLQTTVPAQQIVVQLVHTNVDGQAQHADADHSGDDFVGPEILPRFQNPKAQTVVYRNHFGHDHHDERGANADAHARQDVGHGGRQNHAQEQRALVGTQVACGTQINAVHMAHTGNGVDQHREGGFNTNVHQIPGQTSFTPITFSKGIMLGQTSSSKWMKRIFALLSQNATAGVGAGFRCNVKIQVLSHPNPSGWTANSGTGGVGAQTGTPSTAGPGGQHVSMEIKVYNAWITSLSYGSLDAGANALMVEEMTIVHEGFDVAIASNYGTSATHTA